MNANTPRWWADDDAQWGLPIAEAVRSLAIPADNQQPVMINGLPVAANWDVEVVEIEGIAHLVYKRKEAVAAE